MRCGRSLVGGIGLLYGINTLGAVIGVIGTGFLLLPRLGYTGTIGVAVAVNLTVAAGAFYLSRRLEGSPTPVPVVDGPAVDGPAADIAPARPRISSDELNTIVALAFTGFAAMALQVAWTRTLALVLGPSVYAFSIMLATFLVGLALGSLLFSWILEKWKVSGPRLFWILSAAAGLLSIGSLGVASELPYVWTGLRLALTGSGRRRRGPTLCREHGRGGPGGVRRRVSAHPGPGHQWDDLRSLGRIPGRRSGLWRGATGLAHPAHPGPCRRSVHSRLPRNRAGPPVEPRSDVQRDV